MNKFSVGDVVRIKPMNEYAGFLTQIKKVYERAVEPKIVYSVTLTNKLFFTEDELEFVSSDPIASMDPDIEIHEEVKRTYKVRGYPGVFQSYDDAEKFKKSIKVKEKEDKAQSEIYFILLDRFRHTFPANKSNIATWLVDNRHELMEILKKAD